MPSVWIRTTPAESRFMRHRLASRRKIRAMKLSLPLLLLLGRLLSWLSSSSRQCCDIHLRPCARAGFGLNPLTINALGFCEIGFGVFSALSSQARRLGILRGTGEHNRAGRILLHLQRNVI